VATHGRLSVTEEPKRIKYLDMDMICYTISIVIFHTLPLLILTRTITIALTVLTLTLSLQLFYGPFSGTTRVSQCQKRTSGLCGAREDKQSDKPTIRLGTTPSGLTSAQLHHPPFFYRLDALPATKPTQNTEGYP